MSIGSAARECGFTYVALLIAVAVIAAGLAGVGEVWSQGERRERERELLFAGNQFRLAIERYYLASPAAKAYPQRLSDLLEDRRFPEPRRHLRRIYRDPMTGKAEWGVLEAPTGGIMGVRSLSAAQTLKKAGFSPDDRALEGASRYSEWEFSYAPVGEGSPVEPARRRSN